MEHHRRNYLLLVLDTVLFMNAMTFLSVNAVITLFLSELGASTFEIGLVNAIVSIGSFVSQPIFAKKVMNLTYKRAVFTKILLTQRIFLLVFVSTIPLVAKAHPGFMVVLFLICWTIFSLFIGSYGPFYMSLFAKIVAEQNRGRLRGYSGGLANLLSLGSAAMAGVILKEVPYPYNYTFIFIAGVLLLILDALTFAWMKEVRPDQVTKVDFNYFQYFKVIPEMFREFRPFRRTVIGFSFLVAAQASLAYYALYAVRIFHAGSSEIAFFTAITGMANIIGSVVFGIFADRIGHRFVLILASISGAVAGFLVIGIPSLWSVYAAFALTNFCLNGYNLSSGILIIEQIPRERLPMAISINTMITLVVSSFITIGSSVLVDHFSFASVFLISGICAVLGGMVLFRGGKSSTQVPVEVGRNP